MGVASLILGIFSILCGVFMTGVQWLGVIAGLLGIILGAKGRQDEAQKGII